MNRYEYLAEQLLLSMDRHKHLPLEPVSDAVRGEMAVLRLLSQEENGMHAGEIADMLRMTTSRIAAMLNSLEKKLMIRRITDPKDKRRVIVFLTHTGRAACNERRNEAKAHLTAMLERFCEEDAQTFVRLCSRLFSYACTDMPDKED